MTDWCWLFDNAAASGSTTVPFVTFRSFLSPGADLSSLPCLSQGTSFSLRTRRTCWSRWAPWTRRTFATSTTAPTWSLLAFLLSRRLCLRFVVPSHTPAGSVSPRAVAIMSTAASITPWIGAPPSRSLSTRSLSGLSRPWVLGRALMVVEVLVIRPVVKVRVLVVRLGIPLGRPADRLCVIGIFPSAAVDWASVVTKFTWNTS